MKTFSGYKLLVSFLLLILASVSNLSAQSIIVKEVEFDMVDSGVKKDDFWRMAVEITGGRTTDANAINPKFVDDIEVNVLIGFELEKSKFEFFESSVEIVTIEEGEDAIVRFYLEPEIVERLRLPEEPFAFLVEIKAAGEEVQSTRDMRASMLSTPERIENFKRASRDGNVGDNEGLLVPVYESLFWTGVNRSELTETPAYKRKPSN